MMHLNLAALITLDQREHEVRGVRAQDGGRRSIGDSCACGVAVVAPVIM